MNKFLFIISFLVFNVLVAQTADTTKVIEKYSNGKTFFEGQKVNGIRTGIWTYYDNTSRNRIVSKFDWSNMEEIEYHYYLKGDSRAFILDSLGEQKIINADVAVRFPGGSVVMQQYFFTEFAKLDSNLYKDLDNKVFAHFNISKSGDVVNIKFMKSQLEEYVDISLKLKDKIILILKQVKWIPTEKDGIKYESEKFILPIKKN